MNRLKGYHKISIDVEFKTYAENGIILYSQQKVDGSGDFISLAIVDGYVFKLWIFQHDGWLSVVDEFNTLHAGSFSSDTIWEMDQLF